ncbi:FAD:protein FMN transferase [Tundrisphaera sp. TA3]|uniref:FAD:protein FMN transferase n=1 Tax=Tundrisphaera sp. TA3 TaxID=3435775 RepID=UPI003EBDB9E3
MVRRGFWAAIAVGLAATIPARAGEDRPAPLRRWSFAEPHMGTEFRVLFYSPDEAAATRASRLAFARIAELDAALSDYRPDSELMRLCDRAGGPPVPVGPDLFAVLARSEEFYHRSDGALDITIGPAVRLWRRARRDRKMPDPDLLRKALDLVGGDTIRLDPTARTAQLTRPGTRLDLGAIAKGYASGEAIAVLKREGIDRALVAGSGDIVVSGPPPGQDGWTISVASLSPVESDATGPTIQLRDAAVSTSGDAEQFVEIDGVRYSHVVDPRTGLGLTERRSVTVIAPDGTTADALDTAACILGPGRGMALVESTPGASALFLRIGPDGVERTTSKGWPSNP